MNFPTVEPSTFKSIFFRDSVAVPIAVPDYQRAYSWEQKQAELFIGDLVKYQNGSKGYYFGHFIAENIGDRWEIIDGQQRVTTFVLFLMVCRVLLPSDPSASAYSMIEKFSTVSYDDKALKSICSSGKLNTFLDDNKDFNPKTPPSDKEIIVGLGLSEEGFTRSQRRMVLALLSFHQAFQKKGELDRSKIGAYIDVVMDAHCSDHLTKDKSVAVNIFEMQNTRGIPLTTVEIVKATLMKYVYDHGGDDCESKVKEIQADFGDIYRMEEQLAARSFRGEITMEQLLRLHLRAVDDGAKNKAKEFDSPATSANAGELIAYVEKRLGEKKAPTDGIKYALDLAKEFKKSVRILSETLPQWDQQDPLVGDVLILDRDLSCQFFLIICRRLGQTPDKADGRISSDSLLLWERLLFTRDFHDKYHGLWHRDNFPALFEACGPSEEKIAKTIEGYLRDGFRTQRTSELQSIVRQYLDRNRESVLGGAFYWWKSKMVYAIYKYEANRGAEIREVMKGTVSVEHILPQDWHSLMDGETDEDLRKKSGDKWESFRKEIDGCINGIGNLLLITPGENASEGNKHPAEKKYYNYCAGGSYKEHDQNQVEWRSSTNWKRLIEERGIRIYEFMLAYFLNASASPGEAEVGDGNA